MAMPSNARFGDFGLTPTAMPDLGGSRPPVSVMPPTASQSGNYNAFPGVAPMGGGVLPASGGIPSSGAGMASNKSNAGTGATLTSGPMMGFDDGGVVPDDTQDAPQGATPSPQGAASSTLDPMQIVRGALTFGRQKMGLPSMFYGSPDNEQDGTQQSFDDGGEVENDTGVLPDEGTMQAQSTSSSHGGGQAVNPKSTMAYLTGTGGVSPEIADALEKRLDPQGTMDPAERKMRAISVAPTPDAQFGLMQHYRSRYNAYSGFAKAAMDGGQGRPADLGAAAHAATQAFANVPTGYSVKFAPASHGVAMSATKIGGQKTQAFDDGGEVDTRDDRYANLPDSENVEDRREEGAPGEPAMDTADAVKYNLKNEGRGKAFTWSDAWKRTADKIGSKAFADGGEVDDEEGVLPSDTAAVTQDQGATDEPLAAPAQADTTGQPVVLSPDQFKQMLDAGYDKPLDSGWEKFLNGIMSAISPATAPATTSTPTSPATPEAPAAPQPGFGEQWTPVKAVMQKLKGLAGAEEDTAAAVAADQPAQTPMPRPRPQSDQGGQGGQSGQGGNVTVAQTADRLPAEQGVQRSGGMQTPAQDPYDRAISRIEDQASKLFPMVSQGAQRSNYIAHMTERLGEQQNKIDVARTQAGGRQDVARTNQEGRAANLQTTEQGRNLRAFHSGDVKTDIAKMNNAYRAMNSQEQALVRMVNSRWANKPGLDSKEVMAQITPIANQLNLHPDDLFTMAKNVGNLGGTGGQQQRQGQPEFPRYNAKAIEYLRANPNLKDQFDQVFGPGMAAKALGQ